MSLTKTVLLFSEMKERTKEIWSHKEKKNNNYKQGGLAVSFLNLMLEKSIFIGHKTMHAIAENLETWT